MIGFRIGVEGSNQKHLSLGFVIAVAAHLVVGFFIHYFLKVKLTVDDEYSHKVFNVALIKPEDKIDELMNEPLDEGTNDEDSLSNKIIESITATPEPIILIQPSKDWLVSEVKSHFKENPESMEIFKQSFVINQNNDSEAATYLRESDDGIISVKKELFGIHVCYSFDAKDDSFGTVDFELLESCNEKPNFNFKMRRLE